MNTTDLTPKGYDTDAPESTDRIQTEISQTRAEMGKTLDAIQRKLSADGLTNQLMGEAMTYFRTNGGDAMKDYGRRIGGIAAKNPMPLALIGIGAAWLAMSNRRSADDTYYPYLEDPDNYGDAYTDAYVGDGGSSGPGLMDKAKGKLAAAREKMSSTVQGARDKVSQVSSEAGDKAGSAKASIKDMSSRATRTARSQYESTVTNVQHMMDERPLAVGLLGLGIGMALGALLQISQQENRLMGRYSDRAVAKAKETGKTHLEGVKATVKDEAQNLTARVKETLANGTATSGGVSQSDPMQPADPMRPII